MRWSSSPDEANRSGRERHDRHARVFQGVFVGFMVVAQYGPMGLKRPAVLVRQQERQPTRVELVEDLHSRRPETVPDELFHRDGREKEIGGNN